MSLTCNSNNNILGFICIKYMYVRIRASVTNPFTFILLTFFFLFSVIVLLWCLTFIGQHLSVVNNIVNLNLVYFLTWTVFLSVCKLNTLSNQQHSSGCRSQSTWTTQDKKIFYPEKLRLLYFCAIFTGLL